MMNPSSRIALPRGLLGMLILILACEQFVARHDRDFTNPAPANWAFAARATSRGARRSELLCFGTSLSKYGLLPRVLEKATGLAGYNLAVGNGRMPAAFFLLRRALAAGAKPKVVVIDNYDGPIERLNLNERNELLAGNMRQWPELLSVADTLDLAWAAADPGFFFEMMLSRLFPSAKARFEIRNYVLTALQGNAGANRYSVDFAMWNWNTNRGAFAMPGRELGPTTPETNVVATTRQPFDSARYVRNEVSDSYAHRFLKLASDRGIQVVWMLPPLPTPFQKGRDETGFEAYFTQFSEELSRKYPNVVIVDARDSGYPAERFCDVIHLDRIGATTLSDDVGAVIRKMRNEPANAPRRVALPKFRQRSSDAPLEDLDQSQVASQHRPGKKGLSR